MEPYISEKEADLMYSIMTKVDATGGRWQTGCIHKLCEIIRNCLQDKPGQRATIEEVRYC